jgi:hypothetical protein
MVVRLVLWSLADTSTSVDELRDYLRHDAVDASARVPGLLFAAWISDAATERWGAVHLFESAAAADAPLPPRARELIGTDPEIAEVFDLEASVSVAERLARLGLAFEP